MKTKPDFKWISLLAGAFATSVTAAPEKGEEPVAITAAAAPQVREEAAVPVKCPGPLSPEAKKACLNGEPQTPVGVLLQETGRMGGQIGDMAGFSVKFIQTLYGVKPK